MKYKDFFENERIEIPSQKYADERKRMLESTRDLTKQILEEGNVKENLKVNRTNPEIEKALDTLLFLSKGDFNKKGKIDKMESELISFLNNKLYKKFGKNVKIK